MNQQDLLGPLAPPPVVPVPGTPLTKAPITSVAQVQNVPDTLTDAQKQTILDSNGDGGNHGGIWDTLGTGTYAGLNAATMGIPDLLLSKLDNPVYQSILAGRERNQTANAVGNLAGTVGSMLVPAGAGVEALGNGAKALGLAKTGDTLAGAANFLNSTGKIGDATGFGQIAAQAGRGAAQAATQALPRAATDYGTTGNFDPASLGMQLAGGGVIGGALGGLGQLAESAGPVGQTMRLVRDEAGKTNTDAILSGADVNTGTIKKAMNQTASALNLDRYGNLFNNADSFKEGLADFIVSHGLQDKLTREEYLSDQSPLWQKITDSYNASPLNIGSPEFEQSILTNPNVSKFADDPHVGMEGIQNIAQEYAQGITDKGGNIADFNQSKIFLNNKALNASKLTDNSQTEADLSTNQAKQAIAQAMKSAIDEHALTLDPTYSDLKANYPYVKTLKMASGMEQAKIENPTEEGSATARNMFAGKALAGAGTGFVGGGMVGDDGDKTQNELIGAGLGLVGGNMAARVAGKVATQAQAGVAGLMRNSPAVANTIGGMATRFPAGGASLVQNANLVSGGNQPNPDEQPQLKAPTEGQTGPLTPNQNSLNPGSPNQGSLNPGSPNQPAANQQPNPYHPQMQNPVYQNSVVNRLKTIFQTDKQLQMSGMSFQDFAGQVAAHTNGFDPRFMGKVFFDNPEMQTKYQNSVQTAQQLKTLPISDIINDSQNPFSGLVPENKLNEQRFQALLNGGKEMAKPQAEELHNNLVAIARLPQAKRGEALTGLLKSNYNIDLPTLNQLGAY